jgi:hypothetical protein
MIRVYCKEGESVGGIAVKEHLGKKKLFLLITKKFFSLEINVAPLVIQMTRRFSQMLMAFLFPNKTPSNQEIQQGNKSSIKHPTSTPFKRRSRSAEVRRKIFFLVFSRKQIVRESFVDNI